MNFSYQTKGVCSRLIELEIENNVIVACAFTSGCKGNLQGISKLVIGMNVQDVAEKLSGIACQGETSCPDQLALACQAYLANA